MSTMSREEILAQLKPVVAEQLGVDESEVREDASFTEDLNADSLDLVEVGSAVQESVGAAIEHILGMRARAINVYIQDVA